MKSYGGLFSHLTYLVLLHYLASLRNRKPRRQRSGAFCVQHSPTGAALSTSFRLNHALDQQSLQLNSLITRLRESYSSISMSRESNTLKKSSSWLNSGNALIQHLRENAFSRFPVLPDSAEAQVVWCGIVKCLLIMAALCNRAGHRIFALWFLYSSSFFFFSFLA